jgi:hypothetical protein
LDRDPQFTSPTTYRTLFPWHFLLTERAVSRATGWMMPKSRPMDNIPLSWDAPQEDEIALCVMSLISPYLLLSAPGRLDLHWDNLDVSQLPAAKLQRWKDSLMMLLKKITLRDRRQIVLKSPSHTFRVRTLVEMFPGAKFIYIHRNPYNVFRSTVHLRKTMIQENCLGQPDVQHVEEDIINNYRAAFELYERDKALIPKGHLHEVRFESLEQDPLGQMEHVYRNLNFPGFDALHEALIPELAKLKHYKKNSFKPDPAWMQRAYDELRPAFVRFGYPSPFEELETVAA